MGSVCANLDWSVARIAQDEVRAQDTVFVIGGLTGTKEGQDLAWAFLQEKWTELTTRYSGGFLLSRLVQVCKSPYLQKRHVYSELVKLYKELQHPER